MLGLVTGGQAVRTDAIPADGNRFLFSDLSSGDACIFITAPIQDGLQASVYAGGPECPWRLCGALTNTTPSIFFPIPRGADSLGIALEPLSPAGAIASSSAKTLLVSRVAEHAFNFVSSFGKTAASFPADLQVVPIKALTEWFQMATRKAAADPRWLSSD